ncbi:MAG: polysaccharide biosynthesis protein [Clostridiales bacterium]|nr:polysaccharide biosynthesis protein [Clostridiales bacterium]
MSRRNEVKINHEFFAILGDVIAIFLSAFIAIILQDKGHVISYLDVIWAVINVVVITCSFHFLGYYSLVFKMFSVKGVVKTICLIIAVAGLNLLFAFISGLGVVNYVGVLYFMALSVTSTLLIMFIRKIVPVVLSKSSKSSKTRVMVVGAGDAGVQLIKDMIEFRHVKYIPVCVVDDDPKKQGEYVGGVKVCGTIDDVKEVAEKYKVEEIFVSIPSASIRTREEIVKKCKSTGCIVKTLPDVAEVASGKITVAHLLPVGVEELLGRSQTKVDLTQIKGYIEDKVVLVTGGGGSIGSELCRQIATFTPKQLIILDYYENNAYEIQQELLRKHQDLNLLVLIANIREKDKIRKVFDTYRPQIVFHAAAHKHVPLMETSPNEAVKNNVFGTLNVARAADEFEVETFVQISTDKAVNPTNIMGATKRICEMIIQTIGKHSKKTNFVAVRFGNVLGSNGSVIPLFKKQIEEGGPVTVTHKDIVRYFMTIKEAVSLVLQAGAFAKRGQIFVLDMGAPVKIYDLAENLIRLSGYEPHVDIDIVCTGLRPGEKLYEERLMEEEGLQKTQNGLISIAKPIELDEDHLWATLDRLYQEAYAETDDMKHSVKELVDTYTIFKPL